VVYSYDYDSSYIPAMPIVELQIGRPEAEPAFDLLAIIDTGADATIIPVAILEQIGARKIGKTWMRGTTGNRIRVQLYAIAIAVGPHTQAWLEVVGDTLSDEVILGRDILNHLTTILNGPAHTTQIPTSL
jgi:predicted aspartyl protease